MRLATLELEGFRNFAHARLELGDGFTVLWGHNGAGKTNIIEAIYLLATLRSFRTNDLGALVGRDTARAQVVVSGHDPYLDLPTRLAVQLERGSTTTRRLARADDKLVRSAADFYGRLQAVLFTPEDLAVLREGPQQRRQFLDRMLFARERGHIADVQAYERVVRSRNSVLRDDTLHGAALLDMLIPYEHQIAEIGARVWTRRERLLGDMLPGIERSFADIYGAEGPQPSTDARQLALSLRYVSPCGSVDEHERAAALLARLVERRELDRVRRTTSVGPHRDDLVVELEGRPVAEFASQGQTRAIILALKLAELELARLHTGTAPLLLLDDVSSELDPPRNALLFERLGALAGQCVLTTTAAEFVRLPDAAACRFVGVDRGRLDPASTTP